MAYPSPGEHGLAEQNFAKRVPAWVHRVATDDRSAADIAAEVISLAGWIASQPSAYSSVWSSISAAGALFLTDSIPFSADCLRS